MIKTTRTPKFIRKNEAVKVSMDGSTKELIEEYAAVTRCIAKVFVNSCIPGTASAGSQRRNGEDRGSGAKNGGR